MIEQQVMNYLLWLKDRGQGYFVASEVTTSVATPPEADNSIPVDALHLASPLPFVKVLFVSQHELAASEHEMVSRIAMALNLQTDDFAIAFAGEAQAMADAQGLCSFVFMGENAEGLVSIKEGQTGLYIPHPGAMLKEPQLKVSAWNTLQKLKAAR
ncbi:MAG: hypothetical protein H7318_06675 [Oligoflexus sp.]|nr:hypothetical protein [Oligoflexus sp.]